MPPAPEWQDFFDSLARMRRVRIIERDGRSFWAAAERAPVVDTDEGHLAAVRGWMESTGPLTITSLAGRLALRRDVIETAMAKLESSGQVLRGRFTPASKTQDSELEWCNRRLLARIHRMTLGKLRKEIEPVSSADFMRFLFTWQHAAPGTQLHGVDGTLQVLKQLQGYEISAAGWESEVLRRRIARYTPDLLDRLCLSGEVMWGRLSPHPALVLDDSNSRARRIRPTRVAPVAIFLREDTSWLLEPLPPPDGISESGRQVFEFLRQRGASFLPDMAKSSGLLTSQVEDALWELAAAGLVTADGFENLRALVDPKRRRGEGSARLKMPRHAAGRWAVLEHPASSSSGDERAEAFARQLLLRWGVVFRDLIARETLAPPWRDLLVALRRMEARGEIRGGRFVSGFLGEQYGRAEAVDLLRSIRRNPSDAPLKIPAADPLNLVGIVLPGARISPLASQIVELELVSQPRERAGT
jgi:ATP-dependent Lhr-like helicase